MILAENEEVESLWNKFDKLSDHRTKGWLLVDSPAESTFATTAYLIMVWLGPKLMEKRKPVKIRGLMIVYNSCLVLLNVHVTKDIFLGLSRLGCDYLCYSQRPDYHPEELRVVNALWWYYLSKFLDFGDTLFFILRKKSDQLSVLHVYHHSTMVLFTWTGIKWYPLGAATRIPMMNSFVHIIMYSYYGLSAMGPKVRKYLWWKKYITSVQLIQFCISLFWSVNSLVAGCNHHISIDIWNIFYMCTFLYLFGKFYVEKYSKTIKQR